MGKKGKAEIKEGRGRGIGGRMRGREGKGKEGKSEGRQYANSMAWCVSE